nr:hypothetical protein [uncultured Holophaga sp.]
MHISLAALLVTCLGAATPEPVPAPAPASPAVADLIKIEAIPFAPKQRRDPFKVPTEAELASKGDLVDDIGVKGRVVSNGKVMLVATDSRGNIRTFPVGYPFRDGVIVAITPNAVTFHQWEINTTNKSVYRTVVKTFKPEEGKP